MDNAPSPPPSADASDDHFFLTLYREEVIEPVIRALETAKRDALSLPTSQTPPPHSRTPTPNSPAAPPAGLMDHPPSN
ncbi:hypothetical protein H2201_004058, partial [Coniosporium apollinis]